MDINNQKKLLLKKYLEYGKSNSLDLFEYFLTEQQALSWFERNKVRFSKNDLFYFLQEISNETLGSIEDKIENLINSNIKFK